MATSRTRLLIATLSFTMLFSYHPMLLADPAPVYDADTMAMGPEEPSIQDQADIPPPSPGGGDDSTFVPMQREVQVVPNNANQPIQSADSGGSTRERLKRLEAQLSALQSNDSLVRVDALQNQVQTLRGQVEQLTQQLEQLQTQHRNLIADINKKIAGMNTPTPKLLTNTLPKVINSSSSSTSASPASNHIEPGNITAAIQAKANRKLSDKGAQSNEATADAQPNVAEEQQIYQTAYSLIKAKKYNEAVNVLQNMLQKYPTGQFASNAHYWLGELYGLLGKNDQALAEFNNVVKNYPESPRVADAQLKVGLIYAAQFKWVDAKSTFKKIINRYPGTTSARLASDQLKEIKQAGH